MFRGRFLHNLDAKGRLSIPSMLRTQLQQGSNHDPILTTLRECLGLYRFEDWVQIERGIVDDVPPLLEEVQSMQRLLISGTAEAPVDAQGRILIPPMHRDHAGLEREVIVAGVGPRIEIWNKARFEEELAATRKNMPTITKVVSDRRS